MNDIIKLFEKALEEIITSCQYVGNEKGIFIDRIIIDSENAIFEGKDDEDKPFKLTLETPKETSPVNIITKEEK